MQEFHKGNRQEGLRLQEEFAANSGRIQAQGSLAPVRRPAAITATAKNVWRSTGPTRNMCPTGRRPMLNRKLKLLSELTEHTLAREIEPPREVLRKEFQEQKMKQ